MFKHTQSAQAHTGTHPSLLGTVALFLRQHVRALHRIDLSLPFQQVVDFVGVFQGYFG